MAIYETYAQVYDRSGQIAYALEMLPYLDEALARQAFVGDSTVDVACFDMNTERAFAQNWNDTAYLNEDQDLAIAIKSTYDSETRQATAAIAGFIRRGELYERFQEKHIERAYHHPKVIAALEAGGLQATASYTCFTFEPADDESLRVLWTARKT